MVGQIHDGAARRQVEKDAEVSKLGVAVDHHDLFPGLPGERDTQIADQQAGAGATLWAVDGEDPALRHCFGNRGGALDGRGGRNERLLGTKLVYAPDGCDQLITREWLGQELPGSGEHGPPEIP